MMTERMLKEIAPGGVFHAFGHDYVVLDHNFASVAGEIGVFCLDCGDVKTSRFNPLDAEEPNNYVDSELRDASYKYASQLYRDGLDPKNALRFSVSLNELDGSYGYALVQAVAAPLTFGSLAVTSTCSPRACLSSRFGLLRRGRARRTPSFPTTHVACGRTALPATTVSAVPTAAAPLCFSALKL